MSKQPLVLIVGKLSKNLQKAIKDNYQTLYLPEDPTEQEFFLKAQGNSITTVATSAAHGMTGKLMAALPNLKLVASLGVGYDSLDIQYAKTHGICVTNTPDVLNDCVADLAMGLMIDVARNISYADRFIRAGLWKDRSAKLGRKVSHKTCGIVGLGRIGKAIAKRAEAFDMKIAYYGRHQQSNVSYTYYDDLNNLASACDFLILALPSTGDTTHIINDEVLNHLGETGFLINIARGAVVDEQALVKALQEKRIAGAALDVFEHEPNTPKELWSMDNVVLTNHIGSATYETREAMADLVFENIQSFLAGKGAITPIV